MPLLFDSKRSNSRPAVLSRPVQSACLGILVTIVFWISVLGCRTDGLPAGPKQPSLAHTQPAGKVEPDSAQSSLAFSDRHFDRLFTRSGGGWTGSDGTSSVLLPDGRTVWMFGDTFLGTVCADRSRSADSPLIRNSFVVQTAEKFSTLYATVSGRPADFVSPPDGFGWYWPGDATVENGCLWVFMHRFQSTGTGMWDFQWMGTDMVSFALPDVEQRAVLPVPNGNQVQYGAAILEGDEYVWIYGTEDAGPKKYAHLARVKNGHIGGDWQYFSANGWSSDSGATLRMLDGVAQQYSVLPVDNGYLLITIDNRVPFSNRLVAYRSAHPHGPWHGPVTLYTAPEAHGNIIAYNAFVHTQFTEGNLILISYNLNHVTDFSAIFENADWYRPKFIRVDLKRLLDAFSEDVF